MSSPDDVVRRVREMIGEADEKGTIVQVADRILELLLSSGHAIKQWLSPDVVAVHPHNRDAYGVNPADCHCLMKDIFALGWSWPQVNAIGIEVASEASRTETFNFNERLCQGSAGLLPAAIPHERMKAASLTNGHTNCGLRAIRARVKCEVLEISVEGHFSPEKISTSDHDFGKAINEGLNWTIVNEKIASQCPGLVGLLQAAGNATSQIQKAENEIQVMMRLHACAKSNCDASGTIDWRKVSQLVGRSKPPCEPDIPDLITFVTKKAGTAESPWLLKEVENFHKMHVPSNRTIKGPFFAQLAAFQLDATSTVPFFTMAVLKTQYSCPEAKIRNGECKYISSTDLKQCTTIWRSDVAKCESLMKLCRENIAKVTDIMTEAKRTELMSVMEVRMIMHVMNKKEKQRQTFDSLEAIACMFLDDLKKNLPSDAATHIKFVGVEGAPPSPSEPASVPVASKEKGAAFTSYQASGDLADPMDILRAKGIHLGQDVRRQDADTLYKIVQMSGGFLKMKPESQIKLVSVTINEFVEKWQVAKATAMSSEELSMYVRHSVYDCTCKLCIAISLVACTHAHS